jgi:hypothetical protein
MRHGNGTMKWTDGACYEGQWKHGKAYGLGRFTLSNGDVYFGSWKNDKAHGWGILQKTAASLDKSSSVISDDSVISKSS